LEYLLHRRAELWPGTPVVFAMVDEPTVGRLKDAPEVTGSFVQLKFQNMMTAARAVVPGLKRIAIVGDPLESQPTFRHLLDEIPVAANDVEIIDLTGIPMKELRKRVAVLPDHTAIVYTAIYSDGAGTYYPPADAVALVAEVANRPIVGSFETFIGRGAIGGFVVMPSAVGDAAAELALRILNGERASAIPITAADVVRPVFDWRQLQRWKVDESNLPPGSEIRYRPPSAWEQYRWTIVSVIAVIVLQTALIIALLYEYQRRRRAEVEAHRRTSELAHVNRRSTAGELSTSIAHELNQPLGAILNNTEAAMMMLNSPSPNLAEIRDTLTDIKRDDQRASEIILRLRRLLKPTSAQDDDIDLNQMIRDVFDLVSWEAASRNVTLQSRLAPHKLRVSGDRVQLQQVILNLVVNGIESMATTADGQRKILGSTALRDGQSAEISISDSGPGIPAENLKRIFEPFFTTKEHGMGMGLSIVRTIVEAHGGEIWAENQSGGGATFHVNLRLANVR
jgi:signal transduction histidine kinase